MALQEINEAQLKQLGEMDVGKAAVLIYTPLCGTCKVAERMLDIAEAAGIGYRLYKANINYLPQIREQWRITSIPCLALLDNGRVKEMIYAMQSVDYLHRLLNR